MADAKASSKFFGQLFVTVTGPSGAGKNALTAAMARADGNLALFATATTRAPRDGEIDGVDYYFLEKDDFLNKLKTGDILEHNEIFGRYYGTLRAVVEGVLETGKDALTDMNATGMFQVREKMPENHLSFVVLPPSLAALEDRIAKRRERTNEDEAYIEQRFAKIREDLRYLEAHPEENDTYKFTSDDLKDARLSDFDYVVYNDDLDDAVADVLRIISMERKKRKAG